MIDINELLQEINEKQQCGIDLYLKDDADFIDLKNNFEELLKQDYEKINQITEPQVWAQIIEDCENILIKKSKDIRVGVILAIALFRCQGLDAFLEGLTLINDMIVKYWHTFYPLTEPIDSEERFSYLKHFSSEKFSRYGVGHILCTEVFEEKVSFLYKFQIDEESKKGEFRENEKDLINESIKKTNISFYKDLLKSIEKVVFALDILEVNINSRCNDALFRVDKDNSQEINTLSVHSEMIKQLRDKMCDPVNMDSFNRLFDNIFSNTTKSITKQELKELKNKILKLTFCGQPKVSLKNLKDWLMKLCKEIKPIIDMKKNYIDSEKEDDDETIDDLVKKISSNNSEDINDPFLKMQENLNISEGEIKSLNIDMLQRLVHKSSSKREKVHFQLYLAKRCYVKKYYNLALKLSEEIYTIVSENKVEEWESPYWLSEIYETYYNCILKNLDNVSDADKTLNSLYDKLCLVNVTKAKIIKDNEFLRFKKRGNKSTLDKKEKADPDKLKETKTEKKELHDHDEVWDDIIS